ncbi:uncharacterized protein LOC126470949 [Schistocerca serialis cubense]|uniref:uncharacterized protein LOC126470949 n=1 Tax=Schistocerca serialis cubense TaxID=2023355 RepID=UPI00214F187B|nr:uncharacterized protein LOC126470949 [Schistocerca serialis cubense]
MFKPEHSGSLYHNYKRFFSIVLLAVCDTDYCFTFIDVGSYGKSGELQIYKNSELYKRMKDNNLNLPEPRPLTDPGEPLTFCFIGDEAFALEENVQRPYSGKNLTEKRKIYNYRLLRVRRYIQRTFGILSNKWRIFHRPLNVNEDFCADIIKACCVLRNFVRKTDGFKLDETLETIGLHNVQSSTPVRSHYAASVQDKLDDYFISKI